MEDPGAGSSAGGPPAGAVVVPIDIEAAAPPAAAGARPARKTTTRVRARVTSAAARAAAWTPRNARLAWAAALFLLGCAAAGLALFAMTILPAAESRLLVKQSCEPPTDLRTASEYLLLAASAQMLGATMGLIVPARPFAVFGCVLGWLAGYRANDVLWMLVACHDSSAHGALAFLHFWLFFAML